MSTHQHGHGTSTYERRMTMNLIKQICLNSILAGVLLLYPFYGVQAGEPASKSEASAGNEQTVRTNLQPVSLAGADIPTQEEMQYLTPSRLAEEENLLAILWVQRSAEFRGLSYQAYNLAAMEVDKAVTQRRKKENDRTEKDRLLPLAIVIDIDETIVCNAPLEVYYLNHPGAKADYNAWKKWISNHNPLLPGARDFLKYTDKRGVQVFYVTGRGPKDRQKTEKFLRKAGLPFPDESHLLMNDRSGSKMKNFAKLARRYDIICYLGDNAGDFPIGAIRDENAVVYKKEAAGSNPVSEHKAEAQNSKNKTEMSLDIPAMLKHDKNTKRNRIIDAHKKFFGTKFILLPNPMYGDWENNLAKKYRRLPPEQRIALRKAALKSFQK